MTTFSRTKHLLFPLVMTGMVITGLTGCVQQKVIASSVKVGRGADLEKLAGITEKLQREAKLLKTATNFVKRTADVIGFVEEGLGVLASVGLLA